MKVASKQPKVGQTAPDFTLPDVYGTRRSWREFRGKRALLYMWASW